MGIWHWFTNPSFWLITFVCWSVFVLCATVFERVKTKATKITALVIGVLAFYGWAILALTKLIPAAPALFRSVKASPERIPVFVTFIALIGISLFIFRVYARRAYGLAEIAFAVASIWVAVSKAFETTSESAWVGIAASAYLLVRGLDNATNGWDVSKFLNQGPDYFFDFYRGLWRS